MPDLSRLVARYLSATGNVRVQVNAKATLKARARFGGGIAVGKFLSSIPLYRAIDGEEMIRILDTGEIKGGTYSVAGERAYGAQWGADKTEITEWAEWQRGKRLGDELFLLEIDGKGLVFSHLSGADGKLNPDSGDVVLDASFCYTGLGCSVHSRMQSVKKWYAIEKGKAVPTSLAALQDQRTSLATAPRERDMFAGALISGLPTRIQKALRYEAQKEIDRKLDSWQQIQKWRELGISGKDALDREKLGRSLLKMLCREDCEVWASSGARSIQESNHSAADGQTKFAITAAVIANTTTDNFTADLTGKTVKVKFLDLYIPEIRRWHRVWQPWGDSSATFLGAGRIVFR